MLRQSALLGGCSVASTLVSLLFARHLFVTFGAGVEVSAYYAALAVPQFVASLFVAGIGAVAAPLLATLAVERRDQEAANLLVITAAAFALVGAVLALSAPVWTPVLVPGFSAEALATTVVLTRVHLLWLVASAAHAVVLAYRQSRGEFLRAELVALLVNGAGLAALYVLLPRHGIPAAAAILATQILVQTVLLGIGLPVRPRLRRTDVTRAFTSRLRPILGASAYTKTEVLLDRTLASFAPTGELALFGLAQQIWQSAAQVMSRAVAMPALPRLSEKLSAGDDAGIRREIRFRLLIVAALCAVALPAIVGAWHYGLFQRLLAGRVSPESVDLFSGLLVLLVGYFAGAVAGQLTSTCFLLLDEARLLARIAAAAYTAFVPVKVLATLQFHVLGLAAATAAYYVASVVLQLAFLQRRLQRIPRSRQVEH